MARTSASSDDPGLLTAAARTRIRDNATATLTKTAEFVLHTADETRSDRLWPAEAAMFDTNPLSVAYGACGPALFLHNPATPAELPLCCIRWLTDHPLSVDEYPPGLYVGLAGIASSFLELGNQDKATEVMRLACHSPILFDESGVMFGIAGWGSSALRLFRATRDPVWLDWAVRAGDHLLQTARHDGETCYWTSNHDGRTHFGYGHGASGIALFLFALQVETGVPVYGDIAARAIAFDLAHMEDSSPLKSWKRFEGDTLVEPYLLHGNAGIGSVVIRCHAFTGDPSYLASAHDIAQNSFAKFASTPGLFEGMAGIGEFLLDMYYFTRESEYLDQALDIAESIMWFRICRVDGVAWPGRWLNTISNDYAAGAAGIGLFLARLLRTGDRLFLDQ